MSENLNQTQLELAIILGLSEATARTFGRLADLFDAVGVEENPFNPMVESSKEMVQSMKTAIGEMPDSYKIFDFIKHRQVKLTWRDKRGSSVN